MADIVQTLRNLSDAVEAQQAPHNYVLHLRAGADEVERLRAALERIAKWRGEDLATDGRVIQMENIARAALEGK